MSENAQVNEAFEALISLTEMVQERNYASLAQFFEHLFATYSDKFRSCLKPDTIESNYTGIHFGKIYEENDFLKMIDAFSNNQQLHAKYAVQILSHAVEKLKKMENIRTCDSTNSQTPAIVIVGDLHGNFHDLLFIIRKFGIPGKKFRFVFNGDIVDRGDQQSECLLTIMYALIMYPNRVFVNRGNHEDRSLNLNQNFDPNFKTDTDKKFGKYSMAVFNEAQRVFRYLPLATVVRNSAGYKAFVTHGGLSDRLDLNYISTRLPRSQFDVLHKKSEDPNMKYATDQLNDLLWSDPIVMKHGKLSGNAPSIYG
jgi:hypothetical protein